MNIVKAFARGLFAFLFKLFLPLLAVMTAVVMVLGTSGPLKAALRTSNVYVVGTSQIGKQIKPSNDSDNKDQDSAQQAAIQSAAVKAISPAFLQSTAEQIIDGMYGWLDQKTPQPQFSIDISGVKQQFTQALGDYAVNRAQTLPVCTLAQTRQLAGSKIDPLTTPCIPRGFDISSLRGQVADQINKQGSGKDNNILASSTITPDSLPKDDQGKTPIQNITEKAKMAPHIFHWVKLAPWLLGGLTVVSGGLLWLLYEDKRRGLRNIARALLVEGIILLLIAIVSMVLFNRLESQSGPLAKALNNDFEQPVLSLVHTLSNDLNRGLLIFGAAYTILSIIVLSALHFTKPEKPAEAHVTEHHPVEPVPETEAEKEAASDALNDAPEQAEETPKEPSKSKK